MNIDNMVIKENLEKCIKFDYTNLCEYISELAHRVKYFGEKGFIEEYSKEEDIEYSRKCGKAHNCFLIGLIEYLCNKNGVELSSVIDKNKDIKMDFLMFHPGDITFYEETESLDEITESYNEALDEFIRHNMVLGKDIFDVV